MEISDVPEAPEPLKMLTIGGSDSGGAAGIQADLRAWAVQGAYGMSAVTAVTAQNSTRVAGIEYVTADFLALQIDTVLTDYGADAIKTGFIGRSELIAAIGPRLRDSTVVVDPVLVDHRGAAMFGYDVVVAYREHLLPRATVVTPNWHELLLLAGRSAPAAAGEPAAAARALLATGAGAVLVKRLPYGDGQLLDLLVTADSMETYRSARVATENTHGAGDLLSASLALELARGGGLSEAVGLARERTVRAIQRSRAWRLGAGHGPVWPFVET